MDLNNDLKAEAKRQLGDSKVTVTGTMNMWTQMMVNMMRSMARSYLIAFVVITIMMMILVGSVRMGVLSMIASLLPILEGKTPDDWRKAMYYRYYEYPAVHSVHKHYGVRTQRHKLIFFHELGEWELYDVKNDPREMKSVYADPQYAGVVKELKSELNRLRDLYKDDDTVRGQPINARPPRKRRR